MTDDGNEGEYFVYTGQESKVLHQVTHIKVHQSVKAI
jgi:hypothetical protein